MKTSSFVTFIGYIVIISLVTVDTHPSGKKSNEAKQDGKKATEEKLIGSQSNAIYHSLPMPFVHYPFPFVNSYTPRYFPYGYAGLGHGYLNNALGYAYGFNTWL